MSVAAGVGPRLGDEGLDAGFSWRRIGWVVLGGLCVGRVNTYMSDRGWVGRES